MNMNATTERYQSLTEFSFLISLEDIGRINSVLRNGESEVGDEEVGDEE
jgi:hypothetical protein